MIEIYLTRKMLINAILKSHEMGEIKNSIEHGKGNIVGFLGEEAARYICDGEEENTFDYDIIKNGKMIDSKAKGVRSTPMPHYNCMVPAAQKGQDCDWYIFVRVSLNFDKAWIMGAISKEDFFNQADLKPKGYDDHGYIFKCDAYIMPANELILPDRWRNK